MKQMNSTNLKIAGTGLAALAPVVVLLGFLNMAPFSGFFAGFVMLCLAVLVLHASTERRGEEILQCRLYKGSLLS